MIPQQYYRVCFMHGGVSAAEAANQCTNAERNSS